MVEKAEAQILSDRYDQPRSAILVQNQTAVARPLHGSFLHTKYEEYLPIDGHYVYQQTSRTNWLGPVKLKFALVWRLWDANRKGGAR